MTSEGVYVLIAADSNLSVYYVPWSSPEYILTYHDREMEANQTILSVCARLTKGDKQIPDIIFAKTDTDFEFTLVSNKGVNFYTFKQGNMLSKDDVIGEATGTSVMPFEVSDIKYSCKLSSLNFIATSYGFVMTSLNISLNTTTKFNVSNVICLDNHRVVVLGDRSFIVLDENDGEAVGRVRKRASLEAFPHVKGIPWIDGQTIYIGGSSSEGPVVIDISPTVLYAKAKYDGYSKITFWLSEVHNVKHDARIDLPTKSKQPAMSSDFDNDFKYTREEGLEEFWKITYKPGESDAHFWTFESPLDKGREEYAVTDRFNAIDRDIAPQSLPLVTFYAFEDIDIYIDNERVTITGSNDTDPIGNFVYGSDKIVEVVSVVKHRQLAGKYYMLVRTIN